MYDVFMNPYKEKGRKTNSFTTEESVYENSLPAADDQEECKHLRKVNSFT